MYSQAIKNEKKIPRFWVLIGRHYQQISTQNKTNLNGDNFFFFKNSVGTDNLWVIN